MSRYVLYYEWPEGVDVQDEASVPLDGLTLDTAKLEAAMLYALSEFVGEPPTAYRIVRADGGTEAYRYPDHARAMMH